MVNRINTNATALQAYLNLTKTNNHLTDSIERLSSGLRINKAADDPAGLVVADNLRLRSLSLGQAMRNTSDAVNITQTADSALTESVNIVNLIRTRSLQAAQDSQSEASRSAIQSDINQLLETNDHGVYFGGIPSEIYADLGELASGQKPGR